MPPALLGYLVVFLGGGCGSLMRHGINRLSMVLHPSFPAGTMIVNMVGCFAMGAFTAWFALRGEGTSHSMRLLLTTGLLGGFTTFSAFSLDAAYLWQRGQTGDAVVYVIGSVTLSLVAVVAGMALTRQFFA